MHQLQTLGGLDLRSSDGRALAALLQQPRRLALLAYLAAAGPGAMVRRDRLLLLFWPELEDSRGRAALSQALHVLRRNLGPNAIVTRGTEEVGIDPAWLVADVVEFEAALARQQWEAAARLYGGEFLSGFHLGEAPEFGQWLDETRGALRRRARLSFTRLADQADAAGDAALAVAWSRRALALDPLDESLLRSLLTRLGAAGDRTGAARAYEDFAARLSRELQLAPAPETAGLRDAILTTAHPAGWRPPPPAGSANAPPSAAAPAPAAPAPFVRRPLLYAGLVLLGLMAGALVWRPWSPREASGVERILVLPFAVRGDSTLDYLREGMVDLLASRLEAYGVLQVVDPAQLLAHLAEDDSAGLIPTPKPALARALAQRYDADLYLTGSVVRLGAVIEIAVVLHDRRGDTRATVRREAPDESALGQAVDAIARDLLGRRWSRPADRLLRLAAAETRSPEALRAYLAGERAFRQADYAEARAQFVAATEADPLFALAFYRLSVTGGWLGDSAAYLHGAERAEALADHLGTRDAMLVRAHLAHVLGRVDDAERIYREIVSQYPDDADAWYNLGEVLFHSNGRRGRPIGEAREPFERAAALMGPQPEPALHLVSLRMLEGERASLVPALDSLLRLLPLDAARRASWVTLRAVASGDSADLAGALALLGRSTSGAAIVTAWAVGNYSDRFTLIDSVLEPLTGVSVQAPHRAGSLGLMAHAAAARGAWPVAREYLVRLAAVDHATALETRGWLLAQPWIVAPSEERLAARAALLAAPTERYLPGTMHFTPSPRQQSGLRLFLAGLLALRLGDTLAAETAAARLYSRAANSGGPAFSASLRAELALARHRPDRALEELDALEHARSSLPSDTPQYGSVRERLLRAEALSGVGRYQEAVGWFESCRVIFSYDFAWRGAGQRGLARAATAAGDTLRARVAAANAARLGLAP